VEHTNYPSEDESETSYNQAKGMQNNKQMLESNNKVKAVWKIVKKKTRKYSTEEVTPSIKINDTA
jgi:hypothetical protein